MARVTIEDCIDKMPGSTRFGLCMFASTRAKEIMAGADVTIKHDTGDKAAVIALREIAAGKINCTTLKEIMVKTMQETQQLDEAKEYVASTESDGTFADDTPEYTSRDLIFDGKGEDSLEEEENLHNKDRA